MPVRFSRPDLPFALCTAIALCTFSTIRGGVPESTLPDRTALDDYIAKEDESYSWKVVKTLPEKGATTFVVDMVSQTWRGASEVDRTVWQHWVTIVRPDEVKTDKALLMIGGGRNDGKPPRGADGRTLGLAMAAHAVVAEVRMVPNQPLSFNDAPRPRYEDDLIAHTWNRAMDTGDETWVARMPMVKSAVRAMDTVQALLRSEAGGEVDIKEFVVAGGSKRGWTTWLTGVVDPRVAAIVPIVIDVVNVIPSMEHHYAAYGFWAPAIGDYEQSGIMKRRKSPVYEKLIRLVDPYFYRHRLTMPKYIINSTGDQFFLPDSSQFYFGELRGEKYLRYVPNTKHSLSDSDAIESLLAYFQAIAAGAARPDFWWTFKDDDALRVKTRERPREVRLWQATNPEARDFRLDVIGKAYSSTVLEDLGDGVYVGKVDKPEKGWTAFFVELAYDLGGDYPLKLTTEVRVVPDVLPFVGKLEEENRKAAAADD